MRELAFGTYELSVGATRVLRLDFFPLVADFWRPGEEYAASAFVRPRAETGFAYQADGTGGQSGLEEPAWPQVLTDTVADGDVTWTAADAGSNGVTAVSAPAIDVNPSGEVSAGAPSVVDGKATDTAIQFSLSGAALNKTYRVQCTVTAGTETLVGSLEVRGVQK